MTKKNKTIFKPFSDKKKFSQIQCHKKSLLLSGKKNIFKTLPETQKQYKKGFLNTVSQKKFTTKMAKKKYTKKGFSN